MAVHTNIEHHYIEDYVDSFNNIEAHSVINSVIKLQRNGILQNEADKSLEMLVNLNQSKSSTDTIQFLSIVMSIFNPLGYIDYFVKRAKFLIRKF